MSVMQCKCVKREEVESDDKIVVGLAWLGCKTNKILKVAKLLKVGIIPRNRGFLS